MSRFFVSAATLLAGVAVSYAAAAAPRVTTPIPNDWRFLQGDPQGAETQAFNAVFKRAGIRVRVSAE